MYCKSGFWSSCNRFIFFYENLGYFQAQFTLFVLPGVFQTARGEMTASYHGCYCYSGSGGQLFTFERVLSHFSTYNLLLKCGYCKGQPRSLYCTCKYCRGPGSVARPSDCETSVMTSRPERCAISRKSAKGICRNNIIKDF